LNGPVGLRIVLPFTRQVPVFSVWTETKYLKDMETDLILKIRNVGRMNQTAITMHAS